MYHKLLKLLVTDLSKPEELQIVDDDDLSRLT